MLEVGGRWRRDVLPESGLPDLVKEALQAWLGDRANSRALFIRRPERRSRAEPAAFVAHVDVAGGTARRLDLSSYDDLLDLDLDRDGEPLDGPLLLVCTHARRDQCCARRGVPAYDALRRHVPDGLLWQSSHQGGHRFAACALVLPTGVHLGRVELADPVALWKALLAGRIPLEHYRGRTLYEPAAQAAETAVRLELALDCAADVEVLRVEDGRVWLRARGETVEVDVVEESGPAVPPSCGAEPEPSSCFTTRLV